MKISKDTMKNMTYTPHAKERCKQRAIIKKKININDIKQMPVYTTENGCTKYLDVTNLIVYYVRGNIIVTMISTNPIQMLRYYAFSKKINFNKLCRDYVFNNCKRGDSCRYQHIQINP